MKKTVANRIIYYKDNDYNLIKELILVCRVSCI